MIIWQSLYLSIYLQKSKMGRYFPSEEKEGGKTGHKEEIIRITDDAIKKAKAKPFHKPAKEHGNKSYRKKKKKGADPFPGKKPVDPEALERYHNPKHQFCQTFLF